MVLTPDELAKSAIRCNIDMNQAFNYGLASKSTEMIDNLRQVIQSLNDIVEKSES